MVKIGIVGVGGIANGVHIPGIARSDLGKVVAICDVREDQLNLVGDKLNIPQDHRFTDYRDLIACEDVDAVEICTPNHVHVAIACEAAKAGKPFNCEKPLSVSYDVAKELEETLKTNPVPNMMCFSYRFKSAVRFAKWIIEQGMLGKIVSINVEYLKDSAFMEGRRLDWRFVKEYAGTGVLGDLGVHLIDMAQFLIGDFKSVCSMKGTVVKQRQRLDSDEWAPVETDDYCNFIAEMENDVSASFVITRCAHGRKNNIKFDLYAEKGVLSFDLDHPEILNVCIGEIDIRGNGMHTVTVPDKFKFDQEQMFVNLCSGGATPYLPTVQDGLKCQKILDALLESSETRRWIDL